MGEFEKAKVEECLNVQQTKVQISYIVSRLTTV